MGIRIKWPVYAEEAVHVAAVIFLCLKKKNQSAPARSKLPASPCIKQKWKVEWYMLIVGTCGKGCPDALADRSHLKC